MPEQAKLSIVNYGFNIRTKMDADQQKEDDALIKAARSIITKHNFGKGAVMITEAYHTDLANANNYIYTSENMDKLIKSFYDPFMTPFQCFHNDIGKAIGTNIGAKFIRKPVALSRGVASGYGKLATFIPETSTFEDEPAIDLIQSRRFMAVSIGSKSSRAQMICTICGKSIFSMECDHMPGQEYEGQKCHIKIGNPLFTECSMAGGNPADIDAMVRRMDCFDTNGHQTMEPVVDMISDPWSVAIYDNAIVSQFNLAMDLSDITNKNTDGNEQMADKTIADIINSYEERIAIITKDNEAMAIALTNANKTIAELSAKKPVEEPAAVENTEVPETETETAENTETTEEEIPAEEVKSESTSEEEPATETPPAADNTEVPAPVEEPEKENEDEGTDSQSSEESQENSSEEGAEPPVKDQTPPVEVGVLRSMRNDRLAGVYKSGIQISSKSYRV